MTTKSATTFSSGGRQTILLFNLFYSRAVCIVTFTSNAKGQKQKRNNIRRYKSEAYKNKIPGFGKLYIHILQRNNILQHFIALKNIYITIRLFSTLYSFHLADRVTSLIPFKGEDTAVLCSFKFSST